MFGWHTTWIVLGFNCDTLNQVVAMAETEKAKVHGCPLKDTLVVLVPPDDVKLKDEGERPVTLHWP